MSKNVGKYKTKNLSGKWSQKLLDHAKQSARDVLKITSKRLNQKTAKQLVIWLAMKLLIELQKSQKIYHKIIQKQLQMNMIKKYLKRDLYLQKKDKKLQMN